MSLWYLSAVCRYTTDNHFTNISSSNHANVHRFSFSIVIPGSLIRELASERSNSRSRIPGCKPRKRPGCHSVSYPQSPTTHWRATLPNPAATMARDLEVSLYRLLRFQCMPFFRPRPVGTIRFLPLHTLVRTLNQAAAPFLLGNVRGHELLL